MITIKDRVLRLQILSHARCFAILYISHSLHCRKFIDFENRIDNGCQIEYKDRQRIPGYGEKIKVHRYFITDYAILFIGLSDT